MHARAMRSVAMIMAASAAMVVAGTGPARAQDTQDTQGAPVETVDAPAPNGLALVNQVQNLRDQMQQMQGQIEVLQHKLQLLEEAGKDRYSDLDARLGKLEKAGPPGSASPASPAADDSAGAAPSPAQSVAPPSAADAATAQAEYDAAFKALRSGNYVASARGFRTFIDKYPQSPLVPNAWYWLGGSYSVTQNYKPALLAFQTLVQKYPDSSKAPEAQLRVADCQAALKDFAAARATLKAVIKAHPGTPLAKRAQERINELPVGGGKP